MSFVVLIKFNFIFTSRHHKLELSRWSARYSQKKEEEEKKKEENIQDHLHHAVSYLPELPETRHRHETQHVIMKKS